MLLRRCLDSLIAQSYSDLEIITINDGSTDASLDILYEYASKRYTYRSLRKENGGVSAARNDGIQLERRLYWIC